MADAVFAADFWRRLLALVDSELQTDTELIVIGGAAIALRYASGRPTRDLDHISHLSDTARRAVARAIERMQREEGLKEPPPISYTGTLDAPETFHDRCVQLDLPGFRFLKVYVPERHDLALMKTARGDSRDLDALAVLHEAEPLAFETLLARYNEMQFVGDPRTLRFNFLLLIERLFGESAAAELEKSLKLHL